MYKIDTEKQVDTSSKNLIYKSTERKQIMKKLLSLTITICILVGCMILPAEAAGAPSGIKGNGTSGIFIDINSSPYIAFKNSDPYWGQFAYGREGCAWFASARVNELTGKGSTIYGGSTWYNTAFRYYGFSQSSTPRAKSLACYSGHVAVVEKVDGDIITVSEGGMGGMSDSNHGFCVISTMSKSKLESNRGGTGNFLGYIYLNTSSIPHTCNKGTYVYFWKAHPHPSCYKCSICGEVWADHSTTNYYEYCDTCNTVTVTTKTAVDITETTAGLPGSYYNPSSKKITEYGAKYGKSKDNLSLNAPLSRNESYINGGIPAYVVKELTPGTTYYYRSYVIANGKTYYGDIMSFTTKEKANMWIENKSYSSYITQGNDAKLTGTVKSNNGVKWVWVGIFTSKESPPIQSNDVAVWKSGKTNSYSIDSITSSLDFSKLKTGTYWLSVQCMDYDNNYFTVFENKFFVIGPLVNIKFDTQGGFLGEAYKSCPINGFNVDRGGCQLIVYDKAGTKANTNPYGHEIAVKSSGEVSSLRDYGVSSTLTVPNDGFILSGQGTSSTSAAARFIIGIEPGQYVAFDKKTMTAYAYKTQDAYLAHHKTAAGSTPYGPLPTPVKEGYTFDGWYTSASGGTKVAAHIDVPFSSDHTLYAHWTKEQSPGLSVHFPKVASYTQGQFTDVPDSQWFTNSVAGAVEYGLMKGNSPTTFAPYGDVTIAEAITMAARIHSIHSTGSDSFDQSLGNEWYQVYLDYAYQHGIIDRSYYTCNVEERATRAQYAEIFSNALPAEALYAQNPIADNAIPDVKMSAPYAEDVYKLYRAGILSGGDVQGLFSPLTYITRAESATIVARMANSDNRVSFTLS
ncbi:MAG: S-layer homology domain-containing protein [Clostridiales bacterium]|nr:S-layer homology domain-containing protein [Clostridiales bacterium]MDY4172646.1 S-layer homology domain-containing protein [Evtepia sp.]